MDDSLAQKYPTGNGTAVVAHFADLWRRREVLKRLGIEKSHWHDGIRKGFYPPPIKIGAASRWGAGEIEVLRLAIVSGQSGDGLKSTTASIVAARVSGRIW